MTYCDGKNCTMTKDCLRFNEHIDPKKDEHFAYSPFKNGKCAFFIGVDFSDLNKKITEIMNGKNFKL